MNHQEKLVAIKDLLVLSGRIGLIRPEEQPYWVLAIYGRQSQAVNSLMKWKERPMVVTALLHRWLQMDDGEGVSERVSHALYASLGRDACVLDFSKASYPYSSDQIQGLRTLVNLSENLSTEVLERDAGIQEFVRAIGYVYWLALDTWQKAGKCEVDPSDLEAIASKIQNWPSPNDVTIRQATDTFHLGRRLAICFWEQLSSRNWKPSWMELHQMNGSSPIIALALMMAYVGPCYLESTISEAQEMGVDVPEPPLQIPFSRVFHPIDVAPNEEARDILEAHLPGSVAWFELEVPHQEFSPEDPAIYEWLENQLQSNTRLQQVYSALDLTCWPEFRESFC